MYDIFSLLIYDDDDNDDDDGDDDNNDNDGDDADDDDDDDNDYDDANDAHDDDNDDDDDGDYYNVIMSVFYKMSTSSCQLEITLMTCRPLSVIIKQIEKFTKTLDLDSLKVIKRSTLLVHSCLVQQSLNSVNLFTKTSTLMMYFIKTNVQQC